MSQTAALAKRTVLLDKGRCKTYNTGMRSIVKSLAAGCVSCLGSMQGFFMFTLLDVGIRGPAEKEHRYSKPLVILQFAGSYASHPSIVSFCKKIF